MNLKNNYIFIKKNCWSGSVKNITNFNIYNVIFFSKKIKKNTWRYHILQLCTKNLDDMIYSFWDIECDRLKLVIMAHLLPFYPLPKNQKNHNFKKMKNIAGHIIISHTCTKNYNHIRYGPWDPEWDRQNFLLFWAIFFPLPT